MLMSRTRGGRGSLGRWTSHRGSRVPMLKIGGFGYLARREARLMPGIVRLRVNLRAQGAFGCARLNRSCVRGLGAVFCVGLGAPPRSRSRRRLRRVRRRSSRLRRASSALIPSCRRAWSPRAPRAGSHWTPEQAIYGTASTNDIAGQGRRRHDDQGQRDLSDDGVGRAGQGTVPRAADDDAVRQGPGRLEQPGLGGLAGRRERHRRRRQLPGRSAGTSRSSRTSAAPATRTAAGACSTRSSSGTRSRS